MRIRTKLFLIMLVTILALSLAFAVVVFLWQMSFYRASELDARKQEAESILRQIDDGLADMNAVSLSVVYSNFVKDAFKEYLAVGQEEPAATQNLRQRQSAQLLSEMLFGIVGPTLSVPQVYIFASGEGAFGNGLDTGYREYSSAAMDWYPQAMALEGGKYITSPAEDWRIIQASSFEAGKDYLSLVRVFYDSMNVQQGFVEVMQRSERLFAAVHSRQPQEESKVAVYREDGSLIFQQAGYTASQELPGLRGERGVWQRSRADKGYVLFLPSAQSDFLLVTVVPEQALMRQYIRLVQLLLLVSLLVIAGMAPLVFSISGSVSRPINRLYQSVRSTELESLPTERFADIHSNVLEIVELDKALRAMKFKLSDSMQKLLLTEKHETQARMMALQAQMNPHFLYNTMATLSAMASAGMTAEIEKMCEDLSDLMRYISTDAESLVSVGRELDFTEKYIGCMRARFADIRFSAHVPKALKAYRIPKLSIQLLVENAVKYSTTLKGPWDIRIIGRIQGAGFSIAIEDNGPGFDPAALLHLEERMAEIRRTRVLPTLELDGMGVLNVYIRMLLVFEQDALLAIENMPSGGARVTVGLQPRTRRANGGEEGGYK